MTVLMQQKEEAVPVNGVAEKRQAGQGGDGRAGRGGQDVTVSEKEMFERTDELWRPYYEEEAVISKQFGGRTCDILRDAKRKHRTDMSSKEWGKYEYSKRWPEIRDKLVKNCLQNIDYVHSSSFTSLEEFQDKFERTLRPCVISGLADHWPARTEWNMQRLRRDFGERTFKCGEDDDGYPIKVKLKHFFRYMNSDEEHGAHRDDSPLYIFDSHFDDDKVSKQLLKEYEVPWVFNEDLFRIVGEKKRPPYRWVLFGPTRSGSNVHIDPLGTSAWNTLIRGHKLWTLFPPHFDRALVKGKKHVKKGEDDEPIDWNVNLLERILEDGGPELRSQMIQFIQKPGETVFVPSNWWHGVLNLDTTIAVTQNFCSSGNFEIVWRHTRSGRKKMARTWLRELRMSHPGLAKIADELDEKDGYDLEKEIRLADERHAERKKRKKKHSSNSSSSSSS